MSGSARAWMAGSLLLAGAAFFGLRGAQAIHPLDQLRQGQDLVEQATAVIDAETDRLTMTAERQALYEGIRGLSKWEEEFAQGTIEPRYRLDGPEGIQIRDRIADTLATRMNEVLFAYARGNPQELLDPARQTFEIATAGFPMPPGRFLGFHFVEMAMLLGAQADTIVAVCERGGQPADGARDGFLRRLWDMCQVYGQTHATSGERHLSALANEEWLLRRIRSRVCPGEPYKIVKEYTGMRDNPSERCADILYGAARDTASVYERIACHNWGHIFVVACTSSCADTIRFTYPLPHYREMQLQSALGNKEALPELAPYTRPGKPEEKKAVRDAEGK